MPKLINIVGNRYGELTVIRLADIRLKKRPAWECLCDCGKSRIVMGEQLRGGMAASCGTHRTKKFMEYAKKGSANRSPFTKGTNTHSRLYSLWKAMLCRCNNPKHEAYSRYGGRGIVVCEAWGKFAGFREWALSNGYADDLTIDRVDNDGIYEPSNCRWIPFKDQSRNKRNNIYLQAFGERKLAIEWANDPRCIVTYRRLVKRVSSGQPHEFALTASESEARRRGCLMREARRRGET